MEKINLPIKTTIAALWMQLSGILSFILIGWLLMGLMGSGAAGVPRFFWHYVIFFLISGVFLTKYSSFSKREMGTLRASMILLTILLVLAIFLSIEYIKRGGAPGFVVLLYLLYTPPLILLFLDRKNFR